MAFRTQVASLPTERAAGQHTKSQMYKKLETIKIAIFSYEHGAILTIGGCNSL